MLSRFEPLMFAACIAQEEPALVDYSRKQIDFGGRVWNWSVNSNDRNELPLGAFLILFGLIFLGGLLGAVVLGSFAGLVGGGLTAGFISSTLAIFWIALLNSGEFVDKIASYFLRRRVPLLSFQILAPSEAFTSAELSGIFKPPRLLSFPS